MSYDFKQHVCIFVHKVTDRAPSEVLWGLAINNTCGVPFLTFAWLLAMYFR